MTSYRSPLLFEADQVIDRSAAFNQVSVGLGAVAGSQTVVEKEGLLRQTTITVPSQAVAITDHTTNGAQGSLELYDLPAKRCMVLAAQMDGTISRVGTNLTTTAAVVASVGTAVAGAGDATLTSTEANIIPSSAATLAAGAGTLAALSSAVALLAASQKLYLNFAVPDAGSGGDDSLTVAATITVFWIEFP